MFRWALRLIAVLAIAGIHVGGAYLALRGDLSRTVFETSEDEFVVGFVDGQTAVVGHSRNRSPQLDVGNDSLIRLLDLDSGESRPVRQFGASTTAAKPSSAAIADNPRDRPYSVNYEMAPDGKTLVVCLRAERLPYATFAIRLIPPFNAFLVDRDAFCWVHAFSPCGRWLVRAKQISIPGESIFVTGCELKTFDLVRGLPVELEGISSSSLPYSWASFSQDGNYLEFFRSSKEESSARSEVFSLPDGKLIQKGSRSFRSWRFDERHARSAATNEYRAICIFDKKGVRISKTEVNDLFMAQLYWSKDGNRLLVDVDQRMPGCGMAEIGRRPSFEQDRQVGNASVFDVDAEGKLTLRRSGQGIHLRDRIGLGESFLFLDESGSATRFVDWQSETTFPDSFRNASVRDGMSFSTDHHFLATRDLVSSEGIQGRLAKIGWVKKWIPGLLDERETIRVQSLSKGETLLQRPCEGAGDNCVLSPSGRFLVVNEYSEDSRRLAVFDLHHHAWMRTLVFAAIVCMDAVVAGILVIRLPSFISRPTKSASRNLAMNAGGGENRAGRDVE